MNDLIPEVPEVSRGDAIALGLLAGTTVLFGCKLGPWIREEMRRPEPPDLSGSYLDELVGSVLMFVGLGISIEIGDKLVEALLTGEWPKDLGP